MPRLRTGSLPSTKLSLHSLRPTFPGEQRSLELDPCLHVPQCVSGGLQLIDLGLCERLLDDVSDAVLTQDDWQTQEHVFVDGVVALWQERQALGTELLEAC